MDADLVRRLDLMEKNIREKIECTIDSKISAALHDINTNVSKTSLLAVNNMEEQDIVKEKVDKNEEMTIENAEALEAINQRLTKNDRSFVQF